MVKKIPLTEGAKDEAQKNGKCQNNVSSHAMTLN